MFQAPSMQQKPVGNVYFGLILSGLILMGGCDQESPADGIVSLDTSVSDVRADGAQDMGGEVEIDAGHMAVDTATPEYCGGCHEMHYAQWRSSMHAYATRDPIFLALNKKGIEETNGRLDQFCVQCHAPNASQRGLLPVIEGAEGFEMPIDLDNPLIGHGVQCISCHNIEAVEATQNAQVVYSDSTHFGVTGQRWRMKPIP